MSAVYLDKRGTDVRRPSGPCRVLSSSQEGLDVSVGHPGQWFQLFSVMLENHGASVGEGAFEVTLYSVTTSLGKQGTRPRGME